jgi:hypothetical protein
VETEVVVARKIGIFVSKNPLYFIQYDSNRIQEAAATVWRKQVEAADKEAGHWQTWAVVAKV